MQARQQLIDKLDYVIKEKTISSVQENTQKDSRESSKTSRFLKEKTL